jgi:predicted dehydrogenase
MELLEQGKNLYVEKPLALTTQECINIKDKIKDDQTLMVGHIFLYNDRVKKIKELLPHIGKILHIESNRLNWGRYQKKISTLHSLAPHDVSIIHYLLGYHEFENIIWIGDNFTNNTQNDRDEYSFICNDVSVKFNLSWYYPEKVRTMSITGEKGLIFWDEEARTIKLTTDIRQDDRMNYEPTIEVFEVESNPLRNELKEFVECITTKRTSITDVNNAIDVAKNLDLLSKSL